MIECILLWATLGALGSLYLVYDTPRVRRKQDAKVIVPVCLLLGPMSFIAILVLLLEGK